MHIEFLVEEQSMEAALRFIVPKVVGSGVSFEIRLFPRKKNLLKNLTNRLRGYKRWIPDDWYIFILIDEDRQDCHQLKQQLENMAGNAGIATKSSTWPGQNFHVVNRIVIEELEAWFFGDTEAIHAAYPRIPKQIRYRRPYRNPDAIRGGTWEALERLLKGKDYYKTRMPKIEVAKRISRYMDPDRNRSHSFQIFRDALNEIARFLDTE